MNSFSIIKKEIFSILAKRVMLCDGAMGTMLQSRGYKNASDLLNLDTKSIKDVVDIHLNYIKAGSDIIQTNTFGANFLKLKRSGNEKNLKIINKNGVDAAKEAINLFNSQLSQLISDSNFKRKIYIAGDIGPSGELLQPFGTISYKEMVDSFIKQAEVLLENEVNLILIETMMDLNEAKAAVEAVRALDKEIIIACTLSFNANGVTLMGNKAEQFGPALLEAGCDIIGANCSVGSESMISITEKIRNANPEALLLIQPNAGLPKIVNNVTVFDETPEIMLKNFKKILQFNPNIIGGCCGSTPAHIKALAKLIS